MSRIAQENLAHALPPRTLVRLREVQCGRFSPEVDWFKSPDADWLIVVGLGGSEDQSHAIAWLLRDDKHRLVFLEPEAEFLLGWLSEPGAIELLSHPRCEVHLLDEHILGEIGRQSEGRSLAFLSTRRTVAHLPAVEGAIRGEADSAWRILSEFRAEGTLFYENFYANLSLLSGSRQASSLTGQFHGLPAVICGAGPSLNLASDWIRRISDSALIIAAGSGLNALSAASIAPHFAVAIDPHEYQQGRQLTHSAFETPIFYRARWNKKALAASHGPRLYLGGAAGYPLVDWIDAELGILPMPLEEGPSATCIALEIARFLGCAGVTLVGVDLKIAGDDLYAKGVVYDPKEISGYTVAKWAGEREWIEGYRLRYPHLGITWDNCALISQRPLDLTARVHAAIASAPQIEVDVKPSLNTLRESLVRTADLLSKLETGEELSVIYEIELLSELAYELILEPIKSLIPTLSLSEMRGITLHHLHTHVGL